MRYAVTARIFYHKPGLWLQRVRSIRVLGEKRRQPDWPGSIDIDLQTAYLLTIKPPTRAIGAPFLRSQHLQAPVPNDNKCLIK